MLPLLLACTAPSDTTPAWDFQAAGPSLRGSGYPGRTFTEDELWLACATLDGLESDGLHHNLQMPYRGHLVLPWAPEWGGGGVTLFDMADPCDPVRVGDGESADLRETHALGFMHLPEGDPHAGDWMATNAKIYGGIEAGIMLWDLSDPAAPTAGTMLTFSESWYPDSYTRVTLSLWWQYPWMYVASSESGIFVVDATDPTAPELVNQVNLGLRAGGVFALGNELLVTTAEQTQAALLDISDPANPTLMPGSPFSTVTRDGDAVETYHGTRVGDLALFARKEGGGGPMVMDISDPSTPTFLGDTVSDGNAGYVFYDEGYLFVGESDHGSVWDATDIEDLTLVGTGDLEGDLDTNVPWGNVMLLSVDEPEADHATVVVPWATDPDTKGPEVMASNPEDGSAGWYVGARVGVGFDEFIEPTSAYPGSVRLLDSDGAPVEGWVSAQETIVTYAPKSQLDPGVTYTVEIDGITDIHGNQMTDTYTFTFTTAGG
jgi:hypothetical protein